MKLLSNGDKNAKLAKSNRLSNYTTYGLSLAPAMESGYQTCSSSSVQCRLACIYKSGNGSFPNVVKGRTRKTVLLFEDREEFNRQLRVDLQAAERKAKREKKRVAVRPNMYSDLFWESVAPWIFKEFPDIQWYDYTKHFNRMLKFCRGGLPENYHLTFSRSETNEREVVKVLMAGGNVSVVFERVSKKIKTVPRTWHGFKVVNGDKTDLRFLEGRKGVDFGSVIGLHAKGSAQQMHDGFVVNSQQAMQPLLSSM